MGFGAKNPGAPSPVNRSLTAQRRGLSGERAVSGGVGAKKPSSDGSSVEGALSGWEPRGWRRGLEAGGCRDGPPKMRRRRGSLRGSRKMLLCCAGGEPFPAYDLSPYLGDPLKERASGEASGAEPSAAKGRSKKLHAPPI